MTRRDALLRLTVLFGGTVFGAPRFLSGRVFAAESHAALALSVADLELLGEVAETILPATKDSGGAKAANITGFMQEIARDFYDAAERALLLSAPRFFNEASSARYAGRGFLALEADERYQLLLDLDRREPQSDPYRMVKQLTVWGYWTSEVGARQALTYLPVPGAYRGCVPVAADEKALF